MSSNDNHTDSQTATTNQTDSNHEQRPVLSGAADSEPSEEDANNNRISSAKTNERSANATSRASNAANISNGSSNGNSCNSSKQNKVEKIRECINQCLSEKSRKKISNIINNVVELSDVEKVYLYLNLPTGTPETENSKLRRPGNPFGKKADKEVDQTYVWIESHLEEDSTVSLPKAEVYEQYKLFCESNHSQPLCVADFGKAMKHVFPNIKPRRLGQRGNSRYCYSGLRKKVNFQPPELPDLYPSGREHENELNGEKAASSTDKATEQAGNGEPNRPNNDLQLEQQISQHADKSMVLSACAHVVLEWARKLLSLKVTSIKDLAKHLIQLNHIDKESMAALLVITSEEDDRDEQFGQAHSLNSGANNLLAGRLDKKTLESLKSAKADPNYLTVRKLLESDKKDKHGKKRVDKVPPAQLAKLIKAQQEVAAGKLPNRALKAKKRSIKKEKPSSPDNIKLEPFGDLKNQLNGSDKNLPASFLEVSNEINKTKIPIEPTCHFIDNNTQPDCTQMMKRRHSYGCGPLKPHQLDELGLGNYKVPPQFKRQNSEQLTGNQLTKKRLFSKPAGQHSNGWGNEQQQMHEQTTDDLNLQSTNYTNYLTMNEATAKSNQLVIYKKYLESSANGTTANLARPTLDEHSTEAGGLQPAMRSPSLQNSQSMSSQTDELFPMNNLYENGNQANAFAPNDIYTKNGSNNLINQQTIGYSELAATSMCNTPISSIPASPINGQPKETPFAQQFANQMNQMDKVDYNNNLSTSAGSIGYPYNGSDRISLGGNCPMSAPIGGNQQFTNQLGSESKLFFNQQPALINNKNSTMANNRALTRMRSSSGPSQYYSPSTQYNNGFLANNNPMEVCGNSLAPVLEDQKMTDWGHNAMMNKHTFEQQQKALYVSSNPVSPISEPMSPNLAGLGDKKQLNPLCFNKFSGQAVNKKDGSRSASFTSSNSNDPFSFPIRQNRQRHMSSPFVSTMSSNYSYSSQSLTNSPTTPTSQQFHSSSELYVSNNHQGLNAIDNSNALGSNQLNSNALSSNALNSNTLNGVTTNNPGQLNLNLQETNFMASSKQYQPLTPPLSSKILNDEKKLTNSQLSLMMGMDGHLQPDYNQQTAIQPAFEQSSLSTNSNNLTNRLGQPMDELQSTLQDLQDCDKEFSF